MAWRWLGLLLASCVVLACGGGSPEAASPRSGGFGPNDAVSRDSAAGAPMEAEAISADSGGGADYDEPGAPPASVSKKSDSPPSPAPPPAPGRERRPEPQKPVPGQTGQGGQQEQSRVAAVAQPLLIYTAQLTMAVVEVAKAIAEVEQAGRDAGGFLARRDDTTITIRVPSGRFDETVKRLEKIGDVVGRRVTAEDVTEEFLDIEVRLKNARAIRARLELLLARATKVEESLLIQRELDRVAGEIERMEGRLKFLKDRIAFSTITVTFRAKRTEIIGAGVFQLPVPWLQDVGLRRLLSL